jgi:hypothetical protein
MSARVVHQLHSCAAAFLSRGMMCAGEVRSKARMHVTIGHTTAMAELQFFGLPAAERPQPPHSDSGRLQRPSQTAQQVSRHVR